MQSWICWGLYHSCSGCQQLRFSTLIRVLRSSASVYSSLPMELCSPDCSPDYLPKFIFLSRLGGSWIIGMLSSAWSYYIWEWKTSYLVAAAGESIVKAEEPGVGLYIVLKGKVSDIVHLSSCHRIYMVVAISYFDPDPLPNRNLRPWVLCWERWIWCRWKTIRSFQIVQCAFTFRSRLVEILRTLTSSIESRIALFLSKGNHFGQGKQENRSYVNQLIVWLKPCEAEFWPNLESNNHLVQLAERGSCWIGNQPWTKKRRSHSRHYRSFGGKIIKQALHLVLILRVSRN